jgi:hypothetical protein
MSLSLRIVLFVFSVITAGFVFRKIRKSQMQIADSLYWICFVAILVVLSVFPQIANYACRWVGVMSPVNFIFLAIIFLLLLKVFSLSVKISFLENKLQNFVQEYAIDHVEQDEQEEIKV